MKRQSVALFTWLLLPLLVVGALIWAIGISRTERDQMRASHPPVGAGAGNTGGVNAVGEMLAGNKANHGTPEGRAEESAPPITPAPPLASTNKPPATATPITPPSTTLTSNAYTRRTIPVAASPTDPTIVARDLDVYLPPGYDSPANANASYPVLLWLDGQTLSTDWHLETVAADLLAKGDMRPTILVGVPSRTDTRSAEYLPFDSSATVGRATSLAHWLAGTVLPTLRQNVRVRPGAASAGIGGSGLAAAAALHAAALHPEALGIVLAESPPLRPDDAPAWDRWAGALNLPLKRAYLGVGTAELGASQPRSAELVAAVQVIDERLRKSGLGAGARLLVVQPDAAADQAAWSKRLPQALSFLFPPPLDTTK